MNNRPSIYSKCNPELTGVFEIARHPAKVMCVALDYAKTQHSALICNGLGDVLRSPFGVENSLAGAKELLKTVRTCAKQNRIDLPQVFFGGEDQPSFAENFLRQLRKEDFLVIRVNAADAKKQRDNQQASTDELDLLGIARCCLKRNGHTVQDWPEAYANLRLVTRDRDKLVRQRTVQSNRIHSYIDRLFPGFLNQAKSGLEPFGQASLDLMAEGLNPQSLSRRSQNSLGAWLARRHVDQSAEAARQLKHLAKTALAACPEQALLLQRSLAQLVQLYRHLDQSIGALDREVAYWLARTPGALLTSIGGIGITLAAGWTAELGPAEDWRGTRRLCSYGGVVPKTAQTGGPDKPAVTTGVSPRCNRRFKNVMLQAVEKVCQWGPEDLLGAARKLEANHSHVEFGMAKRLLRIGRHLVRSGTIYRPKALMAPETPKEQLTTYYQTQWEKLLEKWRGKADLKDVFAPKHPLGRWRQMVKELYALELRLPAQRSASVPVRQLQEGCDAGALE